MQPRRAAHPRLALFALAAAFLGAGRAEGGPAADDGVPSGTVAFFSGGLCPPGWTVASAVQGRLVVGATDAAGVGVTVGAPLTDREDRPHQHPFAGTLQLPDKAVAAADGSNHSGAQATDYPVAGTTDLQVTGLPFVQVQPCVKP